MVPWHEIDTVFLDMDGTLLDLHFDNHFWREHVPLRYAEKIFGALGVLSLLWWARYESFLEPVLASIANFLIP